MRFFFFLLLNLCTIVLILQCSEDQNPVSGTIKSYTGSWRWIRTTGGIGGQTTVPGEYDVIIRKYDKTQNYRLYHNDSLKVRADYTIEPFEYDLDKISYSNIITYNYYLNREYEYAMIHGDTLQIWDGNIDGYFSWFIKQ